MNIGLGIFFGSILATGAFFLFKGRKEDEDGNNAATASTNPTQELVRSDELVVSETSDFATSDLSAEDATAPLPGTIPNFKPPVEPATGRVSEPELIPDPFEAAPTTEPIAASTPDDPSKPTSGSTTVAAASQGKRTTKPIGAPIAPPTLKPPSFVKPAVEPAVEPAAERSASPADAVEVLDDLVPATETATELPTDAAEALDDLEPTPAEPVTKPSAESPDARERQRLLVAITSLQEFTAGRALDRDCSEALHTLGSLSLDLDASVRAAAVAAIGGIASAEAIPYLERALRDSDLEVVRAASEAIARYKFYPPAENGEGFSLPLNAAAQAEDMAAIDALEILETFSIRQVRTPPVASPVASALDPERQERLETIAAIQAMTDGRPIDTETLQAVELLGELSLDLDATVRQAAVTAIGHIPSAEAIPYLERALRDSDSDVVGAASAAIARYKFYPPEVEFEPLLPLNAAPEVD